MTTSRRRLCAAACAILSFATIPSTYAQAPGSISILGETLVSAMMLILGNEEKVYILDKAEGNPTKINGHPAWAAEWDIATNQATTMDMNTNTFCSSGASLPNGSFVTFGGNGAIKPGGDAADTPGFDPTYQDFDGSLAIRVINPCTTTGGCQWFDNSTFLQMQRKRWYSTAESLADGSVVLIGGFVNGGYVNRNFPNTDPRLEGGAAEPSYEFYPANGRTPQDMQFMIDTSGLNAYAHAFLMPSGQMFVQANLSTILWDYNKNAETQLPPMPNGVVRVYPASGAVAMLPLTPENNWTPTILFCGGSDIPADAYGNYAGPAINTWEHNASKDCQRITPEPADKSAPAYVQDDDMLDGRTMGQFIALPDGTMFIVNGGRVGTAGYSTNTGQTPLYGNMPFGMSLSADPVFTPAIYDPRKPAGQRWSNQGLQASQIPRLYHSSAILLPDGGVMIAGSNPNVDYNATTKFPTEYRAEKFYPSYFGAASRPNVTGIPKQLSYGGPSFDLIVSPSSFTGNANDAAGNTTVVVIRPGFTTHAMNMGQRFLQLNNTYTVGDDGTITLHCAQMPPNPNLVTPGPVFLFVVVNGIPSNGKMVTVGSGNIEPQQTQPVANLPPNQLSSKAASGSAKGGDNSSDGGSTTTPTTGLSKGVIIGIGAGGLAILAVIGTVVWIMMSRRKSKSFNAPDKSFGVGGTSQFIQAPPPVGASMYNNNDSGAFMPLKHQNESSAWENPSAMASTASFAGPEHNTEKYRDEYDPYNTPPPTSQLPQRQGPHRPSMDSYGSRRAGSGDGVYSPPPQSPRSGEPLYAPSINSSNSRGGEPLYTPNPRRQDTRGGEPLYAPTYGGAGGPGGGRRGQGPVSQEAFFNPRGEVASQQYTPRSQRQNYPPGH